MRVVVRLFAGLRERAGTGEQQVELAEGATAADVWASLPDGLGERPDGLVLAVNRRYAAEDTPLADGDEVALIPPVSGGSPVRLTPEPIDLAAVAAEVADERAGAIATFNTIYPVLRGYLTGRLPIIPTHRNGRLNLVPIDTVAGV